MKPAMTPTVPPTVPPAELETMPIKDLRELRDRVDQALELAVPREKTELKAKLKAMAAEHGLSLSDLVDADVSKTATP